MYRPDVQDGAEDAVKPALQYETQRPSPDDHLALTQTMEQRILADEMGFDYP